MKKNCLTGLLLSLFAFSITSCADVKYNAKLFDDAQNNLLEEFVNNNEINLSSGESDKPKRIIYSVKDKETYDLAFKADYEVKVDFDKQFLIIFSFLSVYKTDHYLKKTDVQNGELIITCSCKTGKPGTGSACSPYQRWCFVKMDIIDYAAISFIGE